jgi:hypothetical protein
VVALTTVFRPSKADKLAQAAHSAARVREYQTDPDVVALRVERVRGWVDRLIWAGMILGLLFTMANVQHFASGGTKPPWEDPADFGIEWVIAWLLDPMVSLVLIGVLMGEQAIGRHQVEGKPIKAGPWVRRTKWAALGATYAMNTWSAWAHLEPSRILLHSVPPMIVFCAAESITTLRHQITKAVAVAYQDAADRAAGLQAVANGAATAALPDHDAPAAVEQVSTPPAVVVPRTAPIELALARTDPTLTDIPSPTPVAAIGPEEADPITAPDPARVARPRPQRPTRLAQATRPVRPTPVEAKADPAPEGDAFSPDLVARALELHHMRLSEHGRPVSGEMLQKSLRIKSARARALRDHIRSLPGSGGQAPVAAPDPAPESDPTPATAKADPTPESDPTPGSDPTESDLTPITDLGSADPAHEPDPTQLIDPPLALTADPASAAGRELALVGGERS